MFSRLPSAALNQAPTGRSLKRSDSEALRADSPDPARRRQGIVVCQAEGRALNVLMRPHGGWAMATDTVFACEHLKLWRATRECRSVLTAEAGR